MITGDNKAVAAEMARVLGMSSRIEGPQGLPVLVTPAQIFLSNRSVLYCLQAFRRGAFAFVSFLDRRQPAPFDAIDRCLMRVAWLQRTFQRTMAHVLFQPLDLHRLRLILKFYSPIYAILFTGISLIVQVFPEHAYWIVETLRQVHLKHLTCHLLRFCAPA
jgi:hypothetical protein